MLNFEEDLDEENTISNQSIAMDYEGKLPADFNGHLDEVITAIKKIAVDKNIKNKAAHMIKSVNDIVYKDQPVNHGNWLAAVGIGGLLIGLACLFMMRKKIRMIALSSFIQANVINVADMIINNSRKTSAVGQPSVNLNLNMKQSTELAVQTQENTSETEINEENQSITTVTTAAIIETIETKVTVVEEKIPITVKAKTAENSEQKTIKTDQKKTFINLNNLTNEDKRDCIRLNPSMIPNNMKRKTANVLTSNEVNMIFNSRNDWLEEDEIVKVNDWIYNTLSVNL